MTVKRAQKISGCEVMVVIADDMHYTEALRDGAVVATANGKKLKEVLSELVEKVYRVHGDAAMKAAEYRCELCGKLGAVQRHHKTHRSMGRRDDTALQILCPACHEKHHRGK